MAQYSHHLNLLVNDLITIRISWLNQGTADAGQFRVTLEDLTEGTTLYDGMRFIEFRFSDSLTCITHSHQQATICA